MHEFTGVATSIKYQALWVSDQSPDQNKFTDLEQQLGISFTIADFSNFTELVDQKNFQIMVFELGESNFEKFLQFQSLLTTTTIKPIFVVFSNNMSVEKLVALVNKAGVVNIADDWEKFASVLNNALVDFQESRDQFNALKRIKNQNVQLELLTQNLENLVIERTKKDYDSSHQALSSLRRIQDILRFIKQVARAESIEEILSCVRKEFKKYHGVRAPLLLFPQSSALLRVFYFQGKQFIERKIVVENLTIDARHQQSQILQAQLSNLFGRPFGNVECFQFDFQSKEAESDRAVLVCENAFSFEERSRFYDENKEKWPIIGLAIENVLLRETSQVTSRQWARTFNEMQDPIFIIDQNYHMTLANAQVSGVSSRICYRDFAGRESPCVDCPISQAIATKEPQSADVNCRGRVYRVHSFPIFLQGQEIVTHLINQYVDMTSTRDLQGRVVQGEKMAAIGMLAGNVAHELNNPLTGIYSLSSLLLEDLDPNSNTAKDLSEIKDAAKRCQSIIKDLLEFSDPTGHQLVQVIDANEMVRKTLPLLKMATRNHNSKVKLDKQPLFVEIHPQLLQQVIFNLVNNACQAMAEGGDLHIRSFREGNRALITIKDTGPGIPQEIRHVIFDPFFTTKQSGKGTGLGLSMSRSIIERYGGSLKLNDKITEGSEFVIDLPIKEPAK